MSLWTVVCLLFFHGLLLPSEICNKDKEQLPFDLLLSQDLKSSHFFSLNLPVYKIFTHFLLYFWTFLYSLLYQFIFPFITWRPIVFTIYIFFNWQFWVTQLCYLELLYWFCVGFHQRSRKNIISIRRNILCMSST